jgi:hypothetical protein
MTAIGLSAVLAAGVVAAANASGQSQGQGDAGSDSLSAQADEPNFQSANFNHPVRNPYFPLKPGTVFRLRGIDEGEHLREVVRVAHRKKQIQGVRATVVKASYDAPTGR